MNPIIHLTSNDCSLIIKVGELPEIMHWGNRIEQVDASVLTAIARVVPMARIDVDVPVGLCPGRGEGLFSAPALEGHRNGKDWAPVFVWRANQVSAQAAEFIALDEVAQLELRVELELDQESDVLRKRITVRNLGADEYQLIKLAATLPLPPHATELLTFHGRWSHEFQTRRRPFVQDSFVQENRRGRTSHENFPGLMAGTKGFSEQAGEVWGFHLGWSGNHQMRADVKSDGRRFVQAGELLLPGEMTLAADESYTSPWLYACHSSNGLNGISDAFHQYVRSQILRFPEDKPRPVHLNTWEGIYFDHDPDYLKQMASEATSLGVERFIIDDGWFVGRHDECSALGDWCLDAKKYPEGLDPVIEHVNDLGMEFGIWLEPEMVSKNSLLYRQHPDWLLELPGYDQPSGRWQYVLNLQNEACFQYLFNRVDSLLSEHHIGYVKWDMNRELVQPGHLGCAAVHGQTLAFYRLVDQIRSRHSQVEIESCSSGGGRVDFEVLRRTHRFWPSDCNDALERQTIQRHMSYFFPPEVMGSHIGTQVSHTTRRMHSLNLRGITALSGHMGLELDPIKESEEEKSGLKHYIRLHKKHRALLHSGRSFRLDSSDASRYAHGVRNDNEMLLTVCQLAMPEYVFPEPLRVGCLQSDQRYRVELIETPKAGVMLMKQWPQWFDQPLELSGQVLNEIGLTLPILDPESALLIHIVKLDSSQEPVV